MAMPKKPMITAEQEEKIMNEFVSPVVPEPELEDKEDKEIANNIKEQPAQLLKGKVKMYKMYNLPLPKEVHLKAKNNALKKDISLKEYLILAIEKYIESEE